MINWLKKLFKSEQVYLPKEGDTIIILKPFWYDDGSDRVWDEYPECFTGNAFRIYRNTVILEYLPGQEYKVHDTYGIDKIDIKTLNKISGFEMYKLYTLSLEPNQYQPNRTNVGSYLNYPLLYKEGYIIEKNENRNRKMEQLLRNNI